MTNNREHKYSATLSGDLHNETKQSLLLLYQQYNPVKVYFKSKRSAYIEFRNKNDLFRASRLNKYRMYIERHNCLNCNRQMKFDDDGTPYYQSSSTIGSKGDWDYIGKQAKSDFDCGACHSRSSSPHRSLRHGEIYF